MAYRFCFWHFEMTGDILQDIMIKKFYRDILQDKTSITAHLNTESMYFIFNVIIMLYFSLLIHIKSLVYYLNNMPLVSFSLEYATNIIISRCMISNLLEVENENNRRWKKVLENRTHATEFNK